MLCKNKEVLILTKKKRLPSINEKMEEDLGRRIEDLKKFGPTNTLQKRIDDEKNNTKPLAKR